MTVNARLGPDMEQATTSLLIANEMCRISIHAINRRFRLGLDRALKDLAVEGRAVVKGA